MSGEQGFTSVHFGEAETMLSLKGRSPWIQKLTVEVTEMKNLEQQIHRLELEAREARMAGNVERVETLDQVIAANQELLADDRRVISSQLTNLTEEQWKEIREFTHLSIGLNILGFSVPK